MPGSFDLRDLLGPNATGTPSGVLITGVLADSRKVKAGDLFFALAGSQADGRAYILDAANRGAAAIAGEGAAPAELSPEIPFASVKDARRALAYAAARF